jgi:type I restriction enzyme S subunit
MDKLPAGWTVRSIADFCKVRTGPFGTLLKASEYSEQEGVPVISVGEIREGYFRITEETPLVPDAVQRRLPQYLLRTGDVVFGRKGAVERSALIRNEQSGWFLGSDGIAVRPDADECPEYIAAQFQSHQVRQWLALNSTGTTMASMNQGVLSRVAIPFPPTTVEQETISAALADAESLIDSLAQLLTKKRLITQGVMQKLLDGTRRLPGFNAAWSVYTIGDIADDVVNINRDAASLPVLTCSKHYGFVDSLGFFKNQVFSNDTSTYKVVKRGQIAYPANHIEEGSIGYQDLYDVALVSPIYVVFQPRSEVNGKFLHRLLKLPQFLPVFGRFTSSSVDRRGSLRWPAFSEIEVSMPRVEEQDAIVEVIEAMEDDIGALEDRLSKARALKQAMAQALLTGRIRLVEPQPA